MQISEIYSNMFPEAKVVLNPCIIHKIQIPWTRHMTFFSFNTVTTNPRVIVTTYPDTFFMIKSYISPTQSWFKLSFILLHIANILQLSSKHRITWFYNSSGVQHIFCGGPKIYFHNPKTIFCLSLFFGSTCCTTSFYGALVIKMWYYSSIFNADWCLNFTEQPLLQPTPYYNQPRSPLYQQPGTMKTPCTHDSV